LTLYNEFEFTRLRADAEPSVQITVTGIEAERVKPDSSNLAYQAFVKFYQHLNQPPPPIQIAIHLHVPLARGLGSSATAIVGGLVGANCLAGSPLSPEEIVVLAIALEGHPDNVVPALVGGCRMAAISPTGSWTICDIPWHDRVIPVIAIPNFELSTAEARGVLPKEYSRADAIFNISHLGLLLRGLATGRADWLQTALDDRIHQPYRRSLIVGYESVQTAAIAAGAYGLVISGAGPTLLALTQPDQAAAVATAMTTAWNASGVSVQTQIAQLDTCGTVSHW
jgi:homoserine kinase